MRFYDKVIRVPTFYSAVTVHLWHYFLPAQCSFVISDTSPSFFTYSPIHDASMKLKALKHSISVTGPEMQAPAITAPTITPIQKQLIFLSQILLAPQVIIRRQNE